MKKTLFFTLASLFFATHGFSQSGKLWASAKKTQATSLSKNTQRLSFPEEFQTFNLDIQSFRQNLATAPKVNSNKQGIVVLFPNTSGTLERFEIFEYSNFTPELQAKFPEIRAYSGKGLDDKLAQIRLSVDPNGVQAMVFRSDKKNEFIEPYSADGKMYAVFNSSRKKGHLPFTCSTVDQVLADDLSGKVSDANRSSAGELLTFRLALSCNGEYANYFGATSAAQSALVLAAFNATMTRVNGIFEKDLAIHMNIIGNTTDVIYYNPATDPYSTALAAWNRQLQSTLTSVIGEANYDVGHMFGASGGGGSAGCIGCICVDGQKGSGKTSPADGIPQGDNFDIDYVAHELGHQFGGNHTFSHNVEGSGVNVELGSGSTIMGYAGLTPYDVQQHSDDYFVYGSIRQIQSNMAGKICAVRTPLAHGTPVVNVAGQTYAIPKSTPFLLTGTASDSNGDALTYCWEQDDTATTQSGTNSRASATKTGGPNWRSYSPVSSPTRYFPRLATVLANQTTTQGSEIAVEALSSVARSLKFVLTVRDNNLVGGQTASIPVSLQVDAASGPFLVTAPNTNITATGATNQNVTWDVAGTNANVVNAKYVDIYLSTDGGQTYPTLLASKVPNDGAETITVPNNPGGQSRIMVKGYQNVFYDISNVNFSIDPAPTTFAIGFSGIAGEQNKAACKGADVSFSFPYKTFGGFSGNTTFAVTGQPAGSNLALSTSSLAADGDVTISITNTAGSAPGLYTLAVVATSGSVTKTMNLYFELLDNGFTPITAVSPANGAQVSPGGNVVLNWTASTGATAYDVQVATDNSFNNVISSGTVTSTSYSISDLLNTSTYYWRVLPKNDGCQGAYSTANNFGTTFCGPIASANVPVIISSSGAPTVNSTLVIPSGSSNIIEHISVNIDVTHTYVGDLTATLISPAGTQIQLFAAKCGGGTDILATFDDSGSVLECGSGPAIGGKIIPAQPLSVLNGLSSEGTWTLRVADSANQDGGQINAWSLNICGAQAPLSVVKNALSDLAVYPNPNSGNFTVRFNSASESDKVQISVYDISGRIIFDKEYANEAVFNQNIQLDKVQSGVYLVKIANGESKQIKRIVVR